MLHFLLSSPKKEFSRASLLTRGETGPTTITIFILLAFCNDMTEAISVMPSKIPTGWSPSRWMKGRLVFDIDEIIRWIISANRTSDIPFIWKFLRFGIRKNLTAGLSIIGFLRERKIFSQIAFRFKLSLFHLKVHTQVGYIPFGVLENGEGLIWHWVYKWDEIMKDEGSVKRRRRPKLSIGDFVPFRSVCNKTSPKDIVMKSFVMAPPSLTSLKARQSHQREGKRNQKVN